MSSGMIRLTAVVFIKFVYIPPLALQEDVFFPHVDPWQKNMLIHDIANDDLNPPLSRWLHLFLILCFILSKSRSEVAFHYPFLTEKSTCIYP